MPRLTKRLIDQLTPRAQEYFVWDTLLPGFGIRVLPSGRCAYLVQYRDAHGRTRRYTLGPHGVLAPETARTLAREALTRVRAGANPAQERHDMRHAPTVAALVERYRRDCLPKLKPKTVRSYQSLLDTYVLPALGPRAVPDVTGAELATVAHRLQATPTQANRFLSLCSTLFTWAETWHLRPPHTNPARGLPRWPETTRERYLTAEELPRLGRVLTDLATTQKKMRAETLALFRLLILTGARLGELQRLRWEWVDWERQLAYLPDSKTGAKNLYLPSPALVVLEGLGAQAQGLVLPGRRPGQPLAHPHRAWHRVCALAGLHDLHLHDLRHTFASMGVTLGLSLPLIGGLLGHTDAATTQRYAHLAPDPMQQAAMLVGEAMQQALGG